MIEEGKTFLLRKFPVIGRLRFVVFEIYTIYSIREVSYVDMCSIIYEYMHADKDIWYHPLSFGDGS